MECTVLIILLFMSFVSSVGSIFFNISLIRGSTFSLTSSGSLLTHSAILIPVDSDSFSFLTFSRFIRQSFSILPISFERYSLSFDISGLFQFKDCLFVEITSSSNSSIKSTSNNPVKYEKIWLELLSEKYSGKLTNFFLEKRVIPFMFVLGGMGSSAAIKCPLILFLLSYSKSEI